MSAAPMTSAKIARLEVRDRCGELAIQVLERGVARPRTGRRRRDDAARGPTALRVGPRP